eukprot:TRINITY_DN3195_c0_g4_i1.p3 TRINITY_DN3195_c0_g4~~TRINITY_DN3195_c0_g4_i1.p3  ORF type:complete len:194 (+),score=44.27 TRINITY_DN3195_c0_g4_i1:2664-3245(+)
MAAAPNVLKPVRVLQASLCLAALGAAGFGLGFEQLNLPNWGVFVVALLSGMGLGGLYSVYEVMVPEVVLWLQRDADASSGSLGSDLDTVSWDNMVYAWVDSFREASSALSFLGAGALLSTDISGAPRFTCGLVPLMLVLCMALMHLAFPHIVLDDVPHETQGSNARVGQAQDRSLTLVSIKAHKQLDVPCPMA